MSIELYEHKNNIYRTLEELQTPPTKAGVFRVITNSYWVFLNNKTCIYMGKYPLCNIHESLTEQLAKKHSPETEIVFVEIGYIPYREDL